MSLSQIYMNWHKTEGLSYAHDIWQTHEQLKLISWRCRLQHSRRVEAGGTDTQMSVVCKLVETQNQPTNTVAKINVLKAVFMDVKKRWSKLKDYVIGYIIWATLIGVDIPPHCYTRDLCVIKLKFWKFHGNVLSLGVCWSILWRFLIQLFIF